jgi:hypothetical protein
MSAIVLLVSTKANSLTSCGPSHLLPLVRLAFRAETVPRRVRQPQPKELLRSAPQRWSQRRRRRQRPMQPLPSRRPWPCQAPPSPPVRQRIDRLCGRRQNANRMASIRRVSDGLSAAGGTIRSDRQETNERCSHSRLCSPTWPLGAVIFIAIRSRFTAGAGVSDEGCCGGTCCEDKHIYAISDSAEPTASKGLERDGGRAKMAQMGIAWNEWACHRTATHCRRQLRLSLVRRHVHVRHLRSHLHAAVAIAVATTVDLQCVGTYCGTQSAAQRHSGTAARRGAMSAAGSVGGSPQVYPDRSVRTPAGADSG